MNKGLFQISDYQQAAINSETQESEYVLGKLLEARCEVCGIEYRHFISNEQLAGRDPVHVMHFHMWSQNPPRCSACKNG